MCTAKAGEINLACNSLRRRKMLMRHGKGNTGLTASLCSARGQHNTAAELFSLFPLSPAFPRVILRETKAVQAFNKEA